MVSEGQEGPTRQQKGLVASVAKKSVKKSGTTKSKASPKTSSGTKSVPAKSSKTVPAVKSRTPKTVKSSIAKASAKLMAKFDDPSVVLKAAKILKRKKLKSKSLARPPVEDLPPVRIPPKPVTSDSKMQKNRAGLSPKELEHFRSLLLEKRREILGDVTSMEREALRSANTNLSTLPLHMADTGTDAYEQEFTLGLVEKDRQLLREIQIALAKIQDGSYGLCEGTGKPISKARLEAQPWARYSIEHARELEKRRFRRPF